MALKMLVMLNRVDGDTYNESKSAKLFDINFINVSIPFEGFFQITFACPFAKSGHVNLIF
tara:strand:+ start:737 stop:916 length:180 start_codon:yes stop_codon:yes gene_type:complete